MFQPKVFCFVYGLGELAAALSTGVSMDDLNYHHLRYFREVAHGDTLTAVADRLNLSQSALSAQIRALEARLGHPLFDRVGRRLELTEVGRIVLDHADRIFGAGEEMLATLTRADSRPTPLRVGAIATLSRNFQLRFLRPVLDAPDVDLELRSGDDATLLDALEALELDVALTTEPPPAVRGHRVAAHRVDEQPVLLHGAPARLRHDDLPALLSAEPVIVPTQRSIRLAFEALIDRLGVTPRIAAEVDDMAMVRLLAREDRGLALAPSVVLADEIAAGLLAPTPFDLGITESFYAVTIPRRFPHPALARLLDQTALG